MDWADLPGNDRVRHCSACDQHVYDFSAMTSAEVEQLVRATEGGLCARLYRRWDGSVMTRNCPNGARPRVRLAIVGGALAVATAAAYAVTSPVRVMGAISMDEEARVEDGPSRIAIPEYELKDVPEDLGESLDENRTVACSPGSDADASSGQVVLKNKESRFWSSKPD